jgi:hypothetical protein
MTAYLTNLQASEPSVVLLSFVIVFRRWGPSSQEAPVTDSDTC